MCVSPILGYTLLPVKSKCTQLECLFDFSGLEPAATTASIAMRLITHNLLTCNKKGVHNGYPLGLNVDEVEVVTCDFQAAFVRKMLTKLDWSAFLTGAKALEVADGLPETIPSAEEGATDDETLRKIHHALLEVHVKQGKLVCPESGRVFPIIDGIPNMLLNEDEI